VIGWKRRRTTLNPRQNSISFAFSTFLHSKKHSHRFHQLSLKWLSCFFVWSKTLSDPTNKLHGEVQMRGTCCFPSRESFPVLYYTLYWCERTTESIIASLYSIFHAYCLSERSFPFLLIYCQLFARGCVTSSTSH